jgi:hypothetical protein
MRETTWPGYTTDPAPFTPRPKKSCTLALGTQASGTAPGSSMTQIQNSRFTRENSAKISTKAVVTIFYSIVLRLLIPQNGDEISRPSPTSLLLRYLE